MNDPMVQTDTTEPTEPIEPTDATPIEPDVNTDEEIVEEEEVEIDYKEEYEKLNKGKKTAQDRIDRQRLALNQLNNKVKEQQQRIDDAQVKDTPQEPSIDDFETNDEYIEALVNFRADAKIKSKSEEIANNQKAQLEQQQLQQREIEFEKVEHTYRQENPNYDAAKKELGDHIAANPIADYAGEAMRAQGDKDGMLPALINYFGANGGENLGEFDKISSMPPLEAVVEIYKIQQKIKAVKTPDKAKPLPKPIKGVKGSSKIENTPKESMDINEWMKKRNKQVRK